MKFGERMLIVNWLREAVEIRERRVKTEQAPQPHPTLFFINDGTVTAMAIRADLAHLCSRMPINLMDVRPDTCADELHGLFHAGVVTGDRGWAKLSSSVRNLLRLRCQGFVYGQRKVPFDEMIFRIKEMA